MNDFPVEILGKIASFMDAEMLTTSTFLSRTFLEVVDRDAYWKQAALVLYPRCSTLSSYLYDWRAMIRDRNRKEKNMTLDFDLDWDNSGYRIFTPWKPLDTTATTATKIRMIIDPFGNPNVTYPEGPCLSVYLETDTDITLAFHIVLDRDPEKGAPQQFHCRSHHFRLLSRNWGTHRLIQRSEITPGSGFVKKDGKISLQIHLSIVWIRLRIVEEDSLRERQGRGMMDMDTPGFQTMMMGGETLVSFRQKYSSSYGRDPVCFWICDHREGEGIIPIKRISSKEERQPLMKVLDMHSNECGQVLLWADRSNERQEEEEEEESSKIYFVKRLQENGSVRWVDRLGKEDLISLLQKKTCTVMEEKYLQPWTEDDGRSQLQTKVILLLNRDRGEEELNTLRKIYQTYFDKVFHTLNDLYDRITLRFQQVSMDEIFYVASKIYVDWRIRQFYQEFHQNKTMFLRHLLRRPHIGYACDRCGTYNFTGTRYRCQECTDYDLCEACHLLPIMPWRFLIPARSINSHKTMTVKIPWKDHQSSHSLYVISL